jgi:hypothetical protein
MPNRRFHRYSSRLIFGKSYDEVHKTLDAPVKYLGRRHRVLYHDPAEAALIGYRIAGLEGAMAALMHVTVDRACSRDKNLLSTIRKLKQSRGRSR